MPNRRYRKRRGNISRRTDRDESLVELLKGSRRSNGLEIVRAVSDGRIPLTLTYLPARSSRIITAAFSAIP